jgi:hypothetical protein
MEEFEEKFETMISKWRVRARKDRAKEEYWRDMAKVT